jgi:AI-2 transport protein TqsA
MGDNKETPASLTPAGRDQAALTTVALCLLVAATAWYLLRQFAPLLRPLLLAVLLCYVILPAHLRLKQRMPGGAAVALMAAASVVTLFLLALMLYASAAALGDDLPQWIERGQDVFHGLDRALRQYAPWLTEGGSGADRAQTQMADQLRAAASALISAAADVLTESIVVGFYLLFLLLEARRFPERVRTAFPSDRAEQILAVARNINEAMASYLRVKVKASLVLAVPVTVVLWALGVKFPGMWGVLTFIANFVPYLGSVFACSLPILLALLQMEFGWRPVAVAVLLVALHMLSAYLVEPRMTGRAVGLSPLVILLALAFWGLCWGLIGMVLAVPLTVMLKIVLENVAFTRPVARLMGEE